MAERRLHDFGRFVRAQDQNSVQSYMFEGGVLDGMDLSASTDGILLVIAPGQAITQDGVIISNDDNREIEFTRTSDPKLYTISLVHAFDELQGGRGSTIELREVTSGGLPVFSDTVVDSGGEVEGVVVGWINYPGGSVDLSDEMLFENIKLRKLVPLTGIARGNPEVDLYTPINLRPPYTDSPGLLVDEGANVSKAQSVGADFLPLTIWTNGSGSGSRNLDLICTPQKPSITRPKKVVVTTVAPGTTSLGVYVIVGGVETLVGSVVSGPLSGTYTFRVPDSLFPESPQASGTSWGIRVRWSIAASQTVEVTQVLVDAGPKPLEP